VNGRSALRDGKVTGEQGGRVLARTAHMPSRPMATGPRVLKIGGRVRSMPAGGNSGDDAQLTIDIRQAPRNPHAQGTLRLKHGADSFEAVEFGVLQSANQWASIAARVRSRPSNEEHSAIVTIEFADPFVDGGPRTVTVAVDGQPRLTGVLQ
jgi:hypothetical protein